MPQLPLNDHEGDALVRHLDSVSMSQLVRREPPPDTSLAGEPAQLTAGGGR